MSHIIAASAIGTLMSFGYTEAEAKRIRGFMPRRFQLMGQVLPLTNIEAWLAYRAVKHYIQQTNERGRFHMQFTSGYLNMMPHEKMKYTSPNWEVEFSTREFVRHFGDALYTDMNEEAGHRIIRLNEDGSFIIKNRRLEQLLREMEGREYRRGVQVSTSVYTNSVAGDLHLPKDEHYSARDIRTMFYHGKLAKEYARQPDGTLLPRTGLDHHEVAKYLHFLYNELLAGKEHGSLFHSERITIQSVMNSRSPFGYSQIIGHLGNVVYFSDGTLITMESVMTNVTTMPMSAFNAWTNTVAMDMARIPMNGHVIETPVIPVTMKDYFTVEEWRA
ncbi:hypothetical protein BIZ78_gp266 [Erwinia phage vB_EamM_Caitlin]|uniref:hypothetical protein n=1 Tax=Erwinia phage vB_EamM_Caitlin TaxID=1883379 RepID=UPI00081C3F17|nr:hypothetical protein BIZ78_gp266 [Erwinia phage vB_EamM_Caitlin]ANZ48309.1 hypothetical protein CAITLIN_14 [Erwinia phage vB_EamM_Caitlin]